MRGPYPIEADLFSAAFHGSGLLMFDALVAESEQSTWTLCVFIKNHGGEVAGFILCDPSLPACQDRK